MLINMPVDELISVIESKQPVPGGGSVSALVGALGVSLIRMYQNLTFDKIMFTQLSENQQQEFRDVYDSFYVIQQKLMHCIDRDACAYQEVLNAFRLPRSNEKEISIRKDAIQIATIVAIESPIEIMESCMEALDTLALIIKNGNPNAISDAGVAVILLNGAIEAANLNVVINLPIISANQANFYRNRCQKIMENALQHKTRSLTIMNEVMGG